MANIKECTYQRGIINQLSASNNQLPGDEHTTTNDQQKVTGYAVTSDEYQVTGFGLQPEKSDSSGVPLKTDGHRFSFDNDRHFTRAFGVL